MLRVIVESPTVQVFNGERYYLCGPYYQRKGSRLHRVVWEHHNGPVPKGYHVHHMDHDRAHNQIENLELLPKIAHLKHHGGTPENKAKKREHLLKNMVPKAAAWHSSPEGKAWHSAHIKEVHQNLPLVEKQCETCGKAFKTKQPTRGRFCHLNCKMAALRRRRGAKEMSAPVGLVCEICGKSFESTKAFAKYCPDPVCKKAGRVLARKARLSQQ